MTYEQIVVAALREGNLIPVGTTPTQAEIDEAFPRLINYIDSLFGMALGEFQTDWQIPAARTAPVPAQYPLLPFDDRPNRTAQPYPPGNVRILLKNLEPLTIYFPLQPNDGAQVSLIDVGSVASTTISANGRLIEGSVSIALSLPQPTTTWFYRADQANWINRTAPAALSTQSVLPSEYDDLLIAGLSIRLSSRYDQEPRSSTVRREQQMLNHMKARYRQPTNVMGNWDIDNYTRQSHPTVGFYYERGLL